MIDPEVARIGLDFLKRVPLKGEEVLAFSRIWNALDQLSSPRPPTLAEPDDDPDTTG